MAHYAVAGMLVLSMWTAANAQDESRGWSCDNAGRVCAIDTAPPCCRVGACQGLPGGGGTTNIGQAASADECLTMGRDFIANDARSEGFESNGISFEMDIAEGGTGQCLIKENYFAENTNTNTDWVQCPLDCSDLPVTLDASVTDAIGPECEMCTECSPCQPGGLVAPDVEAPISLNAEIVDYPEGSAERTAFSNSFASDVAAVLEVEASRVEVTGLESGSLVAQFKVKPSISGVPLQPQALADKFSDPGVILAGVESAAAIALDDIKQTAMACNSPDVLEMIVNCTLYSVENIEKFANLTLYVAQQAQDGAASAQNAVDSETIEGAAGDATSAQQSTLAAQSAIDVFGQQFCASTCAVALQPRWLRCNRGLFMANPLSTALTPFAGIANVFCGMGDREMTGPQVTSVITSGAAPAPSTSDGSVVGPTVAVLMVVFARGQNVL